MNDPTTTNRRSPLRAGRVAAALLAGSLALVACDGGYEVCTTHYPDGELWSVRYYSESRPDRPWVAWYGSSLPRIETDYASGQRTGTWRTLSREGRVLFERSYREDEPHGTWLRFHTDGSPASEARFEDGRPVGRWTWWDADGQVTREERYASPSADDDPSD